MCPCGIASESTTNPYCALSAQNKQPMEGEANCRLHRMLPEAENRGRTQKYNGENLTIWKPSVKLQNISLTWAQKNVIISWIFSFSRP